VNGDPIASTAELAEGVLRGNWRSGEHDGLGFAYTSPSPGRYPWQWYWDSCFAAMVWRRFDPERSKAELESLLAAQRDDGFIGHTIFWNSHVSLTRLPFYNVTSRRAFQTETIQPPLLAWAWRIAVGDPAQEPRIGAQVEWLAKNRDLDGDGLLWILQPDESGLDASPKFDPVWGRRAQAQILFPLLVRRNRKLGFNARRVLAEGGPVLCEVLTNVLWCLSLQALGRPSVTGALVDRLWDESTGLFLDEAGPAGGRPRVATISALAPLALPDLPEAIGRRMIEEHLLDRTQFWTPVAPPSVSASESSYEPGGGHGLVRRYWRGPTWINTAWLVWLGMRRLGYVDEAAQMVESLRATAAREGLREYYDPRDGRGLGARDFAWSTLLLEMIDPDPAAGRSWL
jgi:hypothetical protein